MTQPQECIDKGCVERMDKLDENMERLINPEDGVIGKLHDKINSRIPWTFASIMLIVFIFVVGGSYTYTTLAIASAKKDFKESNDIQDKRVDELRDDIKKLRDEVKTQSDSLLAHRMYTGEKIRK
jgi:hypothetical protein